MNVPELKTPEDFDTPEEYDAYFEYMVRNDAMPTSNQSPTIFQTHRTIQEYIKTFHKLDSLALTNLKSEYQKIYKICTLNGTQPYDYVNRYKKRYDAMKAIADDIGVNVAKPLRSTNDISIDISAIFKKYEKDSRILKNYINEFLGDIRRLPNTKLIDSKLEEFRQIEEELENNRDFV